MAATARGFVGPDAPEAKQIDACVHCGLCLPVCPTYKETKNEASSPRGRIYLMGAVLDGRLPITDGFADEMHFCLGCRACETACPSSVEFGQLVELARAQTEQALPKSLPVRLARRLLLQGLIPYPVAPPGFSAEWGFVSTPVSPFCSQLLLSIGPDLAMLSGPLHCLAHVFDTDIVVHVTER